MFRKLKWHLCLRFPRYKLHCIRRALNLELRQWQTDFALGRSNWMPSASDRCNGKTTAAMLRILMQRPHEVARYDWFYWDPDYKPRNYPQDRWYRQTYREMARACKDAGIPVPDPFILVKL